MRRRRYLGVAGTAALATLAGCTGGDDGASPTDPAGTPSPAASAPRVETVATGFDQPWAVEPLPGTTSLLVTERPGGLSLVDRADGTTRSVAGVPDVFASGQGGLLDATVGPDYPDDPWVYLTHSVARSDGTSSTRLCRGRLDRDAPRLRGVETLHTAAPFVASSGHFGSRVAFGPDDHLYLTVGDRQSKQFGPGHVAQDTSNELGATLRLRPDGSVPDDNPFVDDPGAVDTLFSYGHRNQQGLAVHPDAGAVWASEFGERDGDEINVLRPGANYGWPVADESCRYGTDDPVGVPHADREDVVAPVVSWPCGSGGFPPSGMTFHAGEALPEWRGDLFVGGLASQYLARFRVEDGGVTEADPLLADRGWRVRDVATAPEGLYVAVDAGDAPVVRIT